MRTVNDVTEGNPLEALIIFYIIATEICTKKPQGSHSIQVFLGDSFCNIIGGPHYICRYFYNFTFLTILGSSLSPLENVTAIVLEHFSPYQGKIPRDVTLPVNVKTRLKNLSVSKAAQCLTTSLTLLITLLHIASRALQIR